MCLSFLLLLYKKQMQVFVCNESDQTSRRNMWRVVQTYIVTPDVWWKFNFSGENFKTELLNSQLLHRYL